MKLLTKQEQEKTLLQFDPNKAPPKVEWATYFPSRHPNFKTHKQKGHALNAFQYRDQGILYWWDPEQDKWVEKFKFEKPYTDDTCDRCGGSFKYETKWKDFHGNERVSTSSARYVRWVSKTEPFKREIVCRSCEYPGRY